MAGTLVMPDRGGLQQLGTKKARADHHPSFQMMVSSRITAVHAMDRRA
jgi:hypothetical protein